jgi:hypothetical protein
VRTAALSLALAGSLAGLAGCGSGEVATPAACLKGAPAYLSALRTAPGKVELAAKTPISSCLTKNQGSGDLTTVGTSMIRAATLLNTYGRGDLTGPTPVRLGYLVGAATRGASDTAGIHATLIDRLTAAARFSPHGTPLPQGFEPAYRSGYAAGEDHG